MLTFCRLIVMLMVPLAANVTGCTSSSQPGGMTDSGGSNPVTTEQVDHAVQTADSIGHVSNAQAAVVPNNAQSTKGSGEPASAMAPAAPAMSADASSAPEVNPLPSASTDNAMPAGSAGPGIGAPMQHRIVGNLSDKVLATWGSSVCDGFSVPAGAGWPWTLETNFTASNGPKVLHVSTSGHNTDSKESVLERSKVQSADFVVVCLSLGNQGLGSAATETSAQAVVDSYLDDIFTDDTDTDGDPVSLVNYIKSLGAYPIVTLVYPMADYTTMHCQHLVKANILQQAYGVPTINHLGPTNAGNDFGEGDCTWANGRNAPLNVQSDARHPNALGHDEMFYAFPPDLPFALASEVPFPVRPETTDFITLNNHAPKPIRYTPQHALHSYTMQFGFKASNDGTLAAVDVGMNRFVTVALVGGTVHLVTDDEKDSVASAAPLTDDRWHDVAVTYSYVRQRLALYIDGELAGEHDAHQGTEVRELFPQSFTLGGPGDSGRAAAPAVVQVRDLFINRTSLHALEIRERATTAWVGAGSLDVYAPLRAAAPSQNLAQSLQTVEIQP